ncbi:MAG: T9SS type A sorting domain-containing protein [Calditrichaeota bacterium]|nr:T9SS type A sorting domain-containing protein [Calditrichota bacterium]
MRKMIILVAFLLFSSVLIADDLQWVELNDYNLPQGVRLFKGERSNPRLQAFYIDVDLNQPDIAVRPYISRAVKTAPDFCADVGAYAAVNGGFFGGTTSYSSVIYPSQIKAINIQSVTRNGKSYPVIRSLFSQDTLGNLSVNWIYHFDGSPMGLYRFSAPLPYVYNDPQPKSAPQKSDGNPFSEVLVGIGGAPTLIKDGKINITYNEEIMWGSGVGYDNRDPRTAVGYTADNHVILFVADGRQSISEGLGLPEMAQILLDLGCVEAMNLDGGGSTQMAVPGKYINSPSEQRAVPTIFAVIHKDSLGLPRKPIFEKIIDTDDAQCNLTGGGWFPTSNPGSYGSSASMLHAKGDGSAQAVYSPELPHAGKYEVYGWWVAASNRCSDTPIYIKHYGGTDTVRVNQTTNGSDWVLLGTFPFSGSPDEQVIISDAATKGTYVVADAVRLVTFDTTSVVGIQREAKNIPPARSILLKNYPNPFNNQTKLVFSLPTSTRLSINLYDTKGKLIKRVFKGKKAKGKHQLILKLDGLSSGLYFCALTTSKRRVVNKLILLK